MRIGARKQEDLDRLRAEGHDAVMFDLDDPRTFGPALCGVDRMNILTGYTITMTHQTKTVVDAAKKAGVRHIVNQGVFAAEDATDSKYCWFALVEAYIEASGIAWTHLHPNVFLENMLSVSQPIGGTFSTFGGGGEPRGLRRASLFGRRYRQGLARRSGTPWFEGLLSQH
ncbi:NmrA family NAD(P)-binding protein [Pseudomonas duriflava]|uniref:NmrA family NAD(P)-binding protein n=1 Tax=Pseudomonas duriflava TaxID=459528 RepID=UPI001FCAB099|nr:NmrA family NAD(P)-binding protein [Pseudomonas duriflava]